MMFLYLCLAHHPPSPWMLFPTWKFPMPSGWRFSHRFLYLTHKEVVVDGKLSSPLSLLWELGGELTVLGSLRISLSCTKTSHHPFHPDSTVSGPETTAKHASLCYPTPPQCVYLTIKRKTYRGHQFMGEGVYTGRVEESKGRVKSC